MKTINDIKAALSYDTMVDLVSKGQKERAAARMKHEVSRYLGKDPRTVEKAFGIGHAGIMAPKLARMLARL